MRVLLAFDKFKDALSAREACAVAARALGQRHQTEEAPLTDGGEGFCEILTTLAGGTLEPCTVSGPLGEALEAVFGIVEAANVPEAALARLELPQARRLGIIEMALASGLERLPANARDPWRTSTRGTGELIAAATEAGADGLLLGIGGSATNDLGLGALEALGLEQLGEDGTRLERTAPRHWGGVARFGGGLPAELPAIRIACDVSNPLLGPNGATAVYGPQKGLQPGDYDRLERLMGEQARRLCAYFGQPESLLEEPGAGAAGGIGCGLMVAAGARLVAGFPLVSAWLDLETRVGRADAVLTGEGRFDASSLQGKGPGSVIAMARKAGKPVHVFAGKLDEAASVALDGAATAITPESMPLAEALARTDVLLGQAVGQWAAQQRD